MKEDGFIYKLDQNQVQFDKVNGYYLFNTKCLQRPNNFTFALNKRLPHLMDCHDSLMRLGPFATFVITTAADLPNGLGTFNTWDRHLQQTLGKNALEHFGRVMRQLMLNYPYKKLLHWVIDFIRSITAAAEHDPYFNDLLTRFSFFALDRTTVGKGVWKVPYVLGKLAYDPKLRFDKEEWVGYLDLNRNRTRWVIEEMYASSKVLCKSLEKVYIKNTCFVTEDNPFAESTILLKDQDEEEEDE